MRSTAASLLLVQLLLLSACGSPPAPPQSPQQAPAPKAKLACGASQYEAGSQCFDDHQAACASLACKSGCDLHGASPKQIICSSNDVSSSRMTRCGGIANWSCPYAMVCADDPVSSCKGQARLDCIGRCVPAP